MADCVYTVMRVFTLSDSRVGSGPRALTRQRRSSKPLPSFPFLRTGTVGTTHRGSGWLSPQTHMNTDTGQPWGWGLGGGMDRTPQTRAAAAHRGRVRGQASPR